MWEWHHSWGTWKYEILDCGFSCPSCWEYTEESICIFCWTCIDENGQAILWEKWEEKQYDIDSIAKKVNWLVQTKIVEVNGERYEFYGAKTEKNNFVFFLKIGGRDIKVICNPYAKRMIQRVSIKNSKRILFLSSYDFEVLRTIVCLFKKNPEKYALSQLKIFQH